MEWYYAQGDIQRGPVSESVLLDLVGRGVVHPDTLVWCTSMNDWQTFEEVRATGTLLPAFDAVTQAVVHPEAQDRTDPLAITSLVLAIVSWGCGFLVSVAAVVCGHIALNRINAAEGRLAGRPLALGGLVIGYISLAIHALMTLFVILAMFFA